jgi:hypothetical protein
MDSKLSFTLREVANGWLLEIDGIDHAEYIFKNTGPALGMIRKVLKEEVNPFGEDDDS